MVHIIDYLPHSHEWVALLDPYGSPPHRALLTPVSRGAATQPPVFTMDASWPALLQLMSTLPDAVLTPDAKQVADNYTATFGVGHWNDPIQQTLPEGFTPFPWQTEAAAQYPHSERLLLNDEPGTGKSFSAVMAIREHNLKHNSGRSWTLVICPAAVITPWIESWQRLEPDTPIIRFQGDGRRKQLNNHLKNPKGIIVTSYHTARIDLKHLLPVAVHHLIVDEHHHIKNPRSANFKTVRSLAENKHRQPGTIFLSGTPITHHQGDMWPPLVCMWPSAYPSRIRFESRYLEKVEEDYGEKIIGFLPHRRWEFDMSIMGQQRRIAKADALPWLPDKQYMVREVELPREWRKHYDSMKTDMVANLPDSDMPLAAMSVVAQIQFLQALAASPCDVEVSQELDEYGDLVDRFHAIMQPGSWKVAELMEVLDERPGEQVAVFSASRQLVELAGSALEEAGISHGFVVGDQTGEVRDRDIAEFQAGRLRVMLLTTGAGGTGITLTAASCAVFLSRPYALVDALQAEDRLHRIGSEVHDSIDIIDIVARNTVDYAIRTRLLDKGENLADVLRDTRVLREILGGRG